MGTLSLGKSHQELTTPTAVQLTFFQHFFEVEWVGSEAEAADLHALKPTAVGFAQPSARREGQHLPARISISPIKFLR